MVNRPKQIGTAAESAVVKVARKAGFAAADRHVLKGNADEGDVWLLPTGGARQVVIEVKGGHAAEQASDAQIQAWLDETDVEVANAPKVRPGYAAGSPIWTVGFLVTKRKGVGAANADRWWAHAWLGTLDEIRSIEVWGTAARDHADTPVRMTLGAMLRIVREELP